MILLLHFRRLAKIAADLYWSRQTAEDGCIVRPYVQALLAFNHLVHLTFGEDLLPGWEKALDRFKTAYVALPGRKEGEDHPKLALKVHVIFEHVADYLRCV